MSIQVTRSSMPPLEEYIAEISELWETHWLTNMGVKHQTLQENLQQYLGVPNVELLVNGHMALELTLQAFELHGEVITTPFTFASTVHAIVRNGLTPVFCDIDPQTYCLDTTKLENLITEKTCAILPVHVYGNICNIGEIDRIAKKHHLKVIYDAAHSFGETVNGISVGNFGDASCFSFHATKVFHTIEGGAVTYQDTAIGERLYDLKNFGIHGPENVSSVGANAKMNEFCAAMGICNLRHIDDEIAKRAKAAAQYRSRLGGTSGIQLNVLQKDVKTNHAYFPVVFDGYRDTRDEIAGRLQSNGIFARKYFYPLTNSFSCYAGKSGFDANQTPVAKYVSDRVLTLPIYADLSCRDVDKICDIILQS